MLTERHRKLFRYLWEARRDDLASIEDLPSDLRNKNLIVQCIASAGIRLLVHHSNLVTYDDYRPVEPEDSARWLRSQPKWVDWKQAHPNSLAVCLLDRDARARENELIRSWHRDRLTVRIQITDVGFSSMVSTLSEAIRHYQNHPVARILIDILADRYPTPISKGEIDRMFRKEFEQLALDEKMGMSEGDLNDNRQLTKLLETFVEVGIVEPKENRVSKHLLTSDAAFVLRVAV